jgi:methyl-accepting chemotaxis protein
MTKLNQITQQNASSSEELAATAEEMSSQAENLQQQMAFFRSRAASVAHQAGRLPRSCTRSHRAASERPVPVLRSPLQGAAQDFVKFRERTWSISTQ